MNNGVCVSFSIMILSGYIRSSGIAGSYGRFILSFLRNFHIVFHSAYINSHSHQQYQSSLFFTPSPEFIACKFFDAGHFDWCEVIPDCGFDVQFSKD